MRWIEQQRNFLDYTLASLARRKARNSVLLLAYALVIFSLASALFFTRAMKREAAELLAEAPEMVVQRILAGRHEYVPERRMEELRAIPGVRAVQPRLWGYYYNPASGANYTVLAKRDFDHGDGQALIGAGVARTWPGAGQGKLIFRGHDGGPFVLTVAGTLDASTELVSSDLIVVSESAFRRLFGMPFGMATDLALKVRNAGECQVIAEKIMRLYPDSRPILREEMLRTYAAAFDWKGGYMLVLLAGSLLAFLIFAWDKAAGLSAEERAEIGVLKAVGWDTSHVLCAKLWEGLAVSLSAFLLGVLAAWAHVFLASAALFEHALKGWAVLYPRFELRPALDATQLASLFLLTVLPYALITLVPVWRAAIADPDAVMRQA